MWCIFFSLHGLSKQTLDFITADVTSERKELGCNSTASEDIGVSHIGEAVRNGAVRRELDSNGGCPDKRVLHAMRLGHVIFIKSML